MFEVRVDWSPIIGECVTQNEYIRYVDLEVTILFEFGIKAQTIDSNYENQI